MRKAKLNEIVKVKAASYHFLADGTKAKVIEEDRFGSDIAVRVEALESGKKQPIKHEDYEVVTSKFDEGDYVKVVGSSYGHSIKRGSIAKVKEVKSTEGGEFDLVVEGEYSLNGSKVEQIIQESSAVKVEDVVKGAKTSEVWDLTKGRLYEVISRDSNGDPTIIDDAGDEQGLDDSEYIEILPQHQKPEPQKAQPKFKAGDKVRVKGEGRISKEKVFTLTERFPMADGIEFGPAWKHTHDNGWLGEDQIELAEPRVGDHIRQFSGLHAGREGVVEAVRPAEFADAHLGLVYAEDNGSRRWSYIDNVEIVEKPETTIDASQITVGSITASRIEVSKTDLEERAEKDIAELTHRAAELTDTPATSFSGNLVPKFEVNARTGRVICRMDYRWTGGESPDHKGEAQCSPDDQFSPVIGKAIALHRALGLPVPTAYYAGNPKHATVNQHAKIGERIKIVDAKHTYGEYKNGDVLEVEDFFMGDWVYAKGVNVAIMPKEFVVLEESKSSTEKRHAKVGERIKVVNPTMTIGKYKEGDVLTVAKATDTGVFVEEVSIGLFHKEYEVIVEQPQTLKKGDIVRITGTGFNNNGKTVRHHHKVGSIGRITSVDNTKTRRGPKAEVVVLGTYQIVSQADLEKLN